MNASPSLIVSLSVCVISVTLAQPAGLAPATQAAVDARRAELARQAKAETDAAIARRNAGAMPDRLRVTPGNITETRTAAGAGLLTIPLTIFMEDIPAGATIRGHKIAVAIDNLDRPLTVSTNPAGGPGGTVVVGGRGRAAAAPAAPTSARALQFQAPSRKAESIKLIEGDIEFVVPNDGAAIRVPALSTYAGKAVENPNLSRNEIEITYLTQELMSSLRPTWGTSAAAGGAANFATSVLLLVKDPKSRIVAIEIKDANGTPLSRGSTTRNTNALGTSVQELLVISGGVSPAQLASMEAQVADAQAQGIQVPPQALAQLAQARAAAARGGAGGPLIPETAQLSVQIASPESIKTYPFRLENLTLP